ncbi:MAG: transposase [Lachnospiraceae bacterium]|nr:transposase [Lachnospiraceae bacterium]
MGKTRRKFSSEEKLKMVMAVIQDGKAVSDVARWLPYYELIKKNPYESKTVQIIRECDKW